MLMRATACLVLGVLGMTTGWAAGPSIFWASDPVQPGEAVLVAGDGFGSAPTVEVFRLSDGAAGTPADKPLGWPGSAQKAEVLQPEDTGLKFVIPATLKPGQFAFRVTGPAGAVVGRLNQPAIWWVRGDLGASAVPGGVLRLQGRNLGRIVGDPLPKQRTVVQLSGPRPHLLLAESNDFSATVTLPKDLPVGAYMARLHNGYGGSQGWSDPLAVTVAARQSWPQTVLNVKDFGAEGSGITDDTAAVQDALVKAAEKGGGVVYFPRGRYQLSAPLVVPRFTVLRGEQRELVNLFWPDLQTPPEALLRGSNSFALEELTLYASNHRNIIVGDLGSEKGAGNIRLHHVRVRGNAYRGHPEAKDVDERFQASLRLSTGGGDTVRMGGENVVITDCDLYGSGRSLYLSRARHSLVANNDLYNGRWGWYCLEGSDGLIFERNRLTGADLMSTGGGLANYSTPVSQNVYFAGNEYRLMHGWDREAMTTDAGGGAYFGQVAKTDGATITLAADAQWGGRDWTGGGVFILDGKGAGQWRQIVKYDGRNVTLDRPLQVPPDDSSILCITMMHGRYVFVGNSFTDTGAFQFYGTSIECYVVGNTGARMQGFRGLGLHYYGFQPSWYCQFLGNTIAEGNYYHFTSATEGLLDIYGASHEGYQGPLNRGAVVRANRLLSNAQIHVAGTCANALVEGNQIENTDSGIFVSQQCHSVLVRDNHFRNVGTEVVDEVAARRATAERLKKFLGRQEPVAVYDFEDAPGGKVADLSGNRFKATVSGGVTIVDGGVKGKAARFDGTGYLRVDEIAVFNAPDLTVSLWAKPEKLSGRRGLIAKRFAGTGTAFVIGHTGASITFEATDEDGKWSFNFATGPVLKENQWSHLVVVLKQGEGVTIHADGKPVGEKKNPAARFANTEPLIMGREAWGGDPPKGDTPGFFIGLMDQVRVWTRALTPAEVEAEHAKDAPG